MELPTLSVNTFQWCTRILELSRAGSVFPRSAGHEFCSSIIAVLPNNAIHVGLKTWNLPVSTGWVHNLGLCLPSFTCLSMGSDGYRRVWDSGVPPASRRKAKSTTIILFSSPFCPSIHLLITEVIHDLHSLFCLGLLAFSRGYIHNIWQLPMPMSEECHSAPGVSFSTTLRQL